MPKPLTPADFREILGRKLKDLDFDPVNEMVGIYHSGVLAPREKIHVCQTIMEYVYPKLKAIDVQHKHEGGVQIVIKRFSDDSPQPVTIDAAQNNAAALPNYSRPPASAMADIGDDAIATE